MAEIDNIPEMRPSFDNIRRQDEGGNEYWSSRDLCAAMGYSAYWKFQRVIDKAIKVAGEKGMNVDEHFNQAVDMVKIGNGSFRKVNIFRLSRMACMIIAENADNKKVLVQQARDFFSQSVSMAELMHNSLSSNILLYKTAQGEVRVEVIFNSETFWMSQKRMADLFGVDVRTINYHLGQIYETGELSKEATIRKIGIVQTEGDREVERMPLFYNLDAIVAVGYRVNSYQATQFRIWATSVLKEFIIKGYALDDERLKQGKHFGKDYFDELLERIREIRASERRAYQKITDVFEQCSYDYDKNSDITKAFYAFVQNKLHFAVTGKTAAELVYERVNAEKPAMGLTTWKDAPDGKILKRDISVAKNYLNENELSRLNRLVTMFIDYAELMAEDEVLMSMQDWVEQTNQFLRNNRREVLEGKGKVSHDMAMKKAEKEYEIFRVKQDQEYVSEFDREVERYLKGE